MIAGPNGAGKTTSAMDLLPEVLECYEYVNANTIAAALSPFKPEEAALKAGRLMLNRIHQLAEEKKTSHLKRQAYQELSLHFSLIAKNKVTA